MAATRLAEVVARDAQPLEVLRTGEHPLQQLAVAGLELGPLAQCAARVLDPIGQGVANRLQLTQIECSRLAREGRHVRGNFEPREGLRHQSRELPFEAPDLTPQLGAGEALVAAYPQRTSRVSFEQIRHTQAECRSPRRPQGEGRVKSGLGGFQRRGDHPQRLVYRDLGHRADPDRGHRDPARARSTP